MKAPISVCLIVRDEEAHLETCLRSLRPHVSEIVVVDTGSVDGTSAIAEKYADVFSVFTDCNDDDGKIFDFSLARNYCFGLASQPWVMWADGDDEIVGAEHLSEIVRVAGSRGPTLFMFPYEYSHDSHGNVTCLHYRERLTNCPSKFAWKNPIHEVYAPIDNAPYSGIVSSQVRWIHRRKRGKPSDPGRNLRIIKKWEESSPDEPRLLYYSGLEHYNAGEIDHSLKTLHKYMEVSGWDEEKCLAAMKISDIFMERGEFDSAQSWAMNALAMQESWAEPYILLAKVFYLKALSTQDDRHWERCLHFSKLGLSMPPTHTPLFLNPMARDFEVHVYASSACLALRDHRSALSHIDSGLKLRPDDEVLLQNRNICIDHLAISDLNTVMSHFGLSDSDRDYIVSFVTKSDRGNSSDSLNWPAPRTPHGYPLGVTDADFPSAIVTPHFQAWGIPTEYKFDDLPLRMQDQQLQSLVLAVWKEYMLHDEIVPALSFLKSAPYRVKHSPSTEKALRITEKTVEWMSSDSKSQSVNGTGDPDSECGTPLPEPLERQALSRFKLASSILSTNDIILDLGCIDGAMTNRWGLAGYDVTGVDMCQVSVDLANVKAREFNTKARHICLYFKDLSQYFVHAPHFDVITCCDTYEHMMDPVRDLLSPAFSVAHVGTRMAVVTPHGSWMRGSFQKWAHPWRWAFDLGKPWICDEPRAHVRAPTVWTVAEDMSSAGWHVEESRVELCADQDIPGQGNIFTVGSVREPFPKGLDIVISCGPGPEPWNPRTASSSGIGGSETAVIEMSRRLVSKGHRVRVYCEIPPHGEGIFSGVEYRDHKKAPFAGRCDILVAWRNGSLLDVDGPSVKVAWVHDLTLHSANARHILMAHRIMCLSKFHSQLVMEKHDVHPDRMMTTRNGIDLSRFNGQFPRNPHRVIYSSSPDRGLASLLTMWPKIRGRIPDAELHIFYGFDIWEKSVSRDPNQLNLIRSLKSQIADMSPLGVRFHGRVDQKRLAEEMLSSGVWAYPTWFSETSCITAMEAHAAGLRIVTCPIAALNETVGSRGVMVSGDWLSRQFQDKFSDEMIRSMTAPESGDREELMEYARTNFSWDSVANDWDSTFRDLALGIPLDPMIPYLPTKAFK